MNLECNSVQINENSKNENFYCHKHQKKVEGH